MFIEIKMYNPEKNISHYMNSLYKSVTDINLNNKIVIMSIN